MMATQGGIGRRRGSIFRTRATATAGLLIPLLAMFYSAATRGTSACSVPVFRYALERWPAAPYLLAVVCEGPLNDADQALVSRLSEKSADAFPNLTVRVLDRHGAPAGELPEGLQTPETVPLPALLLQYPEESALRGVVWSGPFSELNLRQLIDSPLRRRIVQQLVLGDAAVWVLLESGNAERDNAAARLLQTRLKAHHQTLALPVLESAAGAENLARTNELTVTFSLVRLARNDPEEELLVRLLLNSEDDLNGTLEPMAFPIYGRGRVLYALVGEGINPENIDEACGFLTGPCSCVVKELNPGVDLLMSASWDRAIRPIWTSTDEVLSLIGRRDQVSAAPGSEASAQTGRDASAAPLVAPGSRTVFVRSLAVLAGLSVLAVVIGCSMLFRKRN